MDKEVRILTQEQLDAYERWVSAREAHCWLSDDPLEDWFKDNPNPLPPPVKVLTEEEVCVKANNNFPTGIRNTLHIAFQEGYNACLSDLGLK